MDITQYQIVIPSYKRPDTFKNKTFRLLEKHNLLDRAFLFVIPEEMLEYSSATENKITILKGVEGLVNQRKHIYNQFPDSTMLLFMDDDITDLIDIKKKSVENLDSVISEGFKICKEVGSKLWGIYPVANPFFMDQTVSTDLKYIVGAFYGVLKYGATPEIPMDDKEDFYRTCAYFQNDGIVARLNYYAPITKYYKEKGGMQERRTSETNLTGALLVRDTFPLLATVYTRKSTGNAEIRLKRQKKN